MKIGAPKTWGEWFGTNKRQLTDVAMITRVIQNHNNEYGKPDEALIRTVDIAKAHEISK